MLMVLLLVLLLVGFQASSSLPPPPPAPTPLPAGRARNSFKNVLFIAVDDLRPEIKAYGHDFMHTPHLDKFVRTVLIDGGLNEGYID